MYICSGTAEKSVVRQDVGSRHAVVRCRIQHNELDLGSVLWSVYAATTATATATTAHHHWLVVLLVALIYLIYALSLPVYRGPQTIGGVVALRWRRGAVGRVSGLRARGRGFESRPGTRRRNPGQVSHTCVPLFTKQYKLVPAKGR